MKLDFFTLYLVILLNSVMLCIVWAGFCYIHQNIHGARFLLAACLLTTTGGLLLAFEHTQYARVFSIAGNAFVIFGFCMVWTGVRCFYGMRALWRVNALVMLGGIAVMIFAGDDRASQNVSYAIAQLVPMSLAFIVLIGHGRSLGGIVSACALAVAMAGQGTETILNIARLTGALSTERYYDVASYLLVAVIFGASLWNLGFLLLAIDRLRAELAQLARLDDLTGLPNRRSLLEIADRRLARARRNGLSLALLLIDVDKFKEINDTFGHAAGDACLVHFADTVADKLGSGQTLARLSGDEFGIVMIDAADEHATAIADELVRLVATTPFCWRGKTIPLSISIGVAVWHEGVTQTLSALFEAADIALYEAKRRGRNGYAVAHKLQQPIALVNARLLSASI
ncbi:GGDEF domain-containing protein [Microvirga sp. 2MCAF38]|uniref:GGDEF domain-containing protein n=1 Tax=Microvirga sp. 2MCAF38 TaxID=3232989 RepID=UPI003F95694F